MNQIPQFDPSQYEKKWREKWEEEQIYHIDNPVNAGKPKYYCLDMFPYPSGEGLHVGHWRGYVLSDVWSRYKLLQGFNVLHPMGWDNFGLPAENDAIHKGIHPKISTKKNIDNIRRQLKEIGCIYDWSKEISTTHPDYYKWTQFIFLKMFEMGLAYQKEQPVNWCNDCKVVLANEEVAGGKCERCGGTNIEKRFIKQWMLKITAYAERLLQDLDDLDWPEKVKEMQRNWIGKSIGAEVDFKIDGHENLGPVTVFTTRPDTLFGATFLVMAPEHKLVKQITEASRMSEVDAYIKETHKMSNIDRQTNKDKSGVFTGAYAINPVNGAKLPIWISNYVLMDYGSGAIMAVPAHDERDFQFAQKFGIPIIEVIHSDAAKRNADGTLSEAYVGDGDIVNSDYLNGLNVEKAKETIVDRLEKDGVGKKTVNYKLRDWIFARQRYWGEPIPVVYCDKCGIVPVPEKDLPVELPDVESYKPSDDGSSPLAKMTDWVNTRCPKCGGPARRETDTMPQWAGSSWYFIRYPDRDYKEAFASPESLKKWLPVDMYVGGIEHAVLHLLYARFWTKVLYDAGLVPFKEPFQRLFNQGMVCRRAHRCHKCNRWVYDHELDLSVEPDKRVCPTCGSKLEISMEKMSKSKGNGINPDILVSQYGTDTLRLYELFTGDPAMDSEWNDDGIKACYNLLKRSWNFVHAAQAQPQSLPRAAKAVNKLIKDVESRMLAFKFNTAVSAFMEFINEASDAVNEFSQEDLEKFVVVMSPFAPHFAEEIWMNYFKKADHVFHQPYPKFDEKLLAASEIEYTIHINGKLRMKVMAAPGCSEEALKQLLKGNPRFEELVGDKPVRKTIFVPNKLLNFIL